MITWSLLYLCILPVGPTLLFVWSHDHFSICVSYSVLFCMITWSLLCLCILPVRPTLCCLSDHFSNWWFTWQFWWKSMKLYLRCLYQNTFKNWDPLVDALKRHPHFESGRGCGCLTACGTLNILTELLGEHGKIPEHRNHTGLFLHLAVLLLDHKELFWLQQTLN